MRLHVRTAGVRPGRLVLIGLSVLFALVLSRAVQAQSTTDAVYQVPDQAIVDVVDVLPTPSVALGPDREWMLFIQYPSYPPVAELAERELKLAGMRIKPSIDGRSLLPLLGDPSLSLGRDALFFHYPHYSNPGGRPGGAIRSSCSN